MGTIAMEENSTRGPQFPVFFDENHEGRAPNCGLCPSLAGRPKRTPMEAEVPPYDWRRIRALRYAGC